MSERSVLTLVIDGCDIDVDETDHILPTPQIAFAHSILHYASHTSMSQTGRIRSFIKTKHTILEISPALLVPAEGNEFSHLIRSALLGASSEEGAARLIKQRQTMPPLPLKVYAVSPYANQVMNPKEIDQSTAIYFSMEPQKYADKQVCFSKYPVPALNQLSVIVNAMELSQGIF